MDGWIYIYLSIYIYIYIHTYIWISGCETEAVNLILSLIFLDSVCLLRDVDNKDAAAAAAGRSG